MRKKIITIILGLGWVLFALSLVSGYFFNKLTDTANNYAFSPITWDSHMQIFNGAVQCNLIGDELTERKAILKKEIFSKVEKRVESSNGLIFYFKDDINLLESVLEFIMKEKACCPFFKFDVSILPFNKGIALQISGSEDAIEMLKEYELEEI